MITYPFKKAHVPSASNMILASKATLISKQKDSWVNSCEVISKEPILCLFNFQTELDAYTSLKGKRR